MSAHVRYCASDDKTVILDLKRDRYILLDRVASAMWAQALRPHPAGLAEGATESADVALSRRLGADLAVIRKDFEAFLASCIGGGLLRPGPAPAPPPAAPGVRRAPDIGLAPQALMAMAAVSASLKAGLLQAYGRAEAIHARSACDAPRAARLAERATRAFLLAENVWRYRTAPDDCLPRSLALFTFLRRLGLPAGHRIGVCMSRIQMHAWVELDQRPLLNDPITSAYSLIASIG